MSFFPNDKFVSSNESADEEIDFMEYVGTVAVSDSNSDEESMLTCVPRDYGAVNVPLSPS